MIIMFRVVSRRLGQSRTPKQRKDGNFILGKIVQCRNMRHFKIPDDGIRIDTVQNCRDQLGFKDREGEVV